MILAVDIANSNISIGCIDRDHIYFWERITAVIGQPNLEYAIAFKSLFDIYHIDTGRLEGAIISSVVPPLNRTIQEAIRKITGLHARFVGPGIRTGLDIRMDNPQAVGSDMIVNSVAALTEHKPPIIILDMGTATTLSVINDKSCYVGGCIMPGLRVSLDALSSGTAQLPQISLDVPRHVIGRNTVESMRSGFVYGHASMIDGMLSRIEEELGMPCTVIATGGLVKLLLPLLSHPVSYDGALLLKGLRTLYEKNSSKI